MLQGGGYAAALEAAGVQPGEVVILILQHSEALAGFLRRRPAWRDPHHHAVPDRKTLAGFLPALVEIAVRGDAPAAVVTYPEFRTKCRQAIPAGGSVRQVIVSSEVNPDPEPISIR